ncbi:MULTISPECIES: molecular chaperone DnaJ [Chelativorans]|jgi:molecular chaperone DnaJ|uniref:Chaperone protein DnaJ n=1 Tax=Chelativorans sp. (strain BNC1) TaxID=266779 RepID=DNAJ_CHESB|nr:MULTISPECIES: molecular chaperone DnaJ [Chelativorans]Q11KJ5.1 RecName: Full=Chaperone protein DnaJ [Chelativorans sp. BNC1]
MKADFYETLCVSRNADEKELKSAFRKLAMQYHPDRNPGDMEAEKKFKEINEAYETLRDPQKRAAYDRFGHAAFEQGMGARGGFNGGGFADIFEDIFGDIMGGARQRRSGGRERGADLRYNMEITLEESFTGKTAQIRVPTAVTCDECAGSGARPGSSPVQCPMCHGAGRVRASTGGFFSIERTCPQCQGRGQIIDDPCRKCSGQGRLTEERSLSVNIPAGIEDGTRIRLAGEGEAGLRGGPPGDLYIFLSIKPHEFFQRDGADLYCKVPISMTTAALGGSFEVTTLDGTQTRVKVPEGTQSGRQFRLRGKGMPVLRQPQVGDLYIQVAVETPQNLTRRQRELLEEFEKISSGENSPQSTGFFARMKDFFETFGE